MVSDILRSTLKLNVSRETSEKLEHFAALFQKWSASINLVASSTRDDLWRRHIIDSAQIFKIAPGPKHWIDLGSGGGFPGIVTAILLSETGEGWVDLVESNHKKASFLRLALSETGARGAVHTVRIEEAPAKIASADRISARALADLDRLFGYAEPWASDNPELVCILHKGRDYQSEIDKARGRWGFDLIIHQSAVEADSVVLEIAHLGRTAQ